MLRLRRLLDAIPEGYSTGRYGEEKFGITKSVFSEGRSVKIFAESLSGNDFISLNVYFTNVGPILKPCEMAEEKALGFLEKVTVRRN